MKKLYAIEIKDDEKAQRFIDNVCEPEDFRGDELYVAMDDVELNNLDHDAFGITNVTVIMSYDDND